MSNSEGWCVNRHTPRYALVPYGLSDKLVFGGDHAATRPVSRLSKDLRLPFTLLLFTGSRKTSKLWYSGHFSSDSWNLRPPIQWPI